MHVRTLELVRCPVCRSPLDAGPGAAEATEIEEGTLACPCGRRYPVEGGLPDLTHPPDLLPADRGSLDEYEAGARRYHTYVEWLCDALSSTEEGFRTTLAGLLELRPGHRVLEMACGTGANFPYLLAGVGEGGMVAGVDLTPAMLAVAARPHGRSSPRVGLARANGSHLPFADGTFDAVLHFGGINAFAESERAIAELARVAAPGAKVVIGDEGVGPWLAGTAYADALWRWDPRYRGRPPLHALPAGAAEVAVRWILNGAFYVVDFRAGAAVPALAMELPYSD